MNPGYLSFLLISVTLILCASGWKDILIRGISNKAILLFFVLWVGASRVAIPWNGYRLYLSFILVSILAGIILYKTGGMLVKLHLLSVGLLLGSIYFFLLEAAHLLPVLMGNPGVHASMLVGATMFMLSRQTAVQIACISVGLVAGELYLAYIHHANGYPAALGNPAFQDKWWLSLWTARGCTFMWQAVRSGTEQAVKLWSERKKGGPS